MNLSFQILDLLKQGQAPILESLGIEEIKAFIEYGHLIDCVPGELIIQKNDDATTMFIVLSGSLEIRDGSMIVRQVKPGELIGELAFLLSARRTVDVYAGPHGAQVLSLDETSLREQLLTPLHPEAFLLFNLSKILARKLAAVTRNLRQTQQHMIQQEKLASLGHLTSGIAHELKNPLNFVTNFAGLNKDLMQELLDTLASDENIDKADLIEMVRLIQANAEQTEKHGKRANEIVQNMMQHANHGSGERRQVLVNALVDNFTRVAQQRLQASHPDIVIAIRQELDESAGEALLSTPEIGQVLHNILGNAFEVLREKKMTATDAYEPVISIKTNREKEYVEIIIADNGPGVPPEIHDKIFEPFFTTKRSSTGIGLGLSISHDIVTQGHGGTLTVESKEGEGACFIIRLPIEI